MRRPASVVAAAPAGITGTVAPTASAATAAASRARCSRTRRRALWPARGRPHLAGGVQDWLGAAFHAVALCFLWRGVKATKAIAAWRPAVADEKPTDQ